MIKKKLQPTWENAPGYKDLNNDLESAESAQVVFKDNLDVWSELREGGKPIVPAKVGKSTTRPKLIRKQGEWRYPAMSEPFLNTVDMFKIKPRTAEDVEAAKQNQIVLNYQWETVIDKVKLIGDAVRCNVDEGTVVIKTGWNMEVEIGVVETEEPVYATPEESIRMMQEAVQAGQMSPEQAQAMMETGEPMQTGTQKVYIEEETLVKNHPTYEVCNNAYITIDPTCNGIVSDANFIVHEYDTSYSELKKDAFSEEDGTGFYFNLENLKDSEGETIYEEYESPDKENFSYSDKARKQLRAYEYWGFWDIQGDGVLVSIVATWVGKTLIRLEENPFPHKELPFSTAVYMPVKREIHGEPDAELLAENQASIGKMTRALEDLTAEKAVGQEFIDENLFPSASQRNAYNNGNTVYTRTGLQAKNHIYKKTVEDVPSSIFNVIQYNNTDAESLTGIRAFSNGMGGNSLGSTAAAVRGTLDATAKRELDILRRMSAMFKDMARKTIAMNQAWMSEEQVIRITNGEFIKVRRDDLQGDFDLTVEVSTPEKDNEQAEKLITLMQTNAATMDPKLAQMHYKRIAELWKMPGLAEEVGNFEPQPDPQQQELAQLEIQLKKLEIAKVMKEIEEADSRIIERISRAEENENSDGALKAAKAEESYARAEEATANAEKTRAETDNLDQQFLANEDGSARAEALEDQAIKRNAELQDQITKRNNEIEDKAIDHRVKLSQQEHQNAAALDQKKYDLLMKSSANVDKQG